MIGGYCSNQTNERNVTNAEYNASEFIAANAVISALIYLVNGFLIIFFGCKRRLLLKTPSHRLLLSLAVCDFLQGVGINCQIIIQLYPKFKYPKTVMAVAYRICVDMYTTFLVNSVVMHFCGLTLDRYLSLFYALKYRSIVTAKFLNRYIMVTWLLPLFASLIQLSWLYYALDGEDCNDMRIDHIEIWYSITTFALFLAIPMILLGAAFIRMYFEIRRLIMNTPDPRMSGMSRVSRRQRRVFYVFGLMYTSFTLLALPYFSFRIMIDLNQWTHHDYLTTCFLTTCIYALYTLKISTSLVNPLLYGSNTREIKLLMKHYFRHTIKTIRSRSINLSIRNNKSSTNISSANEVSYNLTSVVENDINNN